MSQSIEQLSDEIERIAGNTTQLPSVAVAEWAYGKLATLNALKFACEGELAKARERIQELEAQAAAMRLDLQGIEEYWNGNHSSAVDAIQEVCHRAGMSLLKNTAGRDLLARIERMEAALKVKDEALKAHVKWHEENDESGGWPESDLNWQTCKALTTPTKDQT